MFKTVINSILNLLKTEEVRKKIFYSLIILVVFRVLAAIPVVGIPADALSKLFAGSNFGELLSTISGGVLQTASLVAIGLNPYINASVTLQLLTPVIPKLAALRKEGSAGRRAISMYTRWLTIPLAILQSFVIYSTLRGFGIIGALPTLTLVAMIGTLTAGAMIMMWMGELISEDGIGGGTSYLIFLGILSGIPGHISTNFRVMDPSQKITFIALNIIIIAIVVFISEAERRIKVMYSRRVRQGATQESYIPLKLTQSGVMPVIFAISLLSFPQLIAQFFLSRNINANINHIAQTVYNGLANPYVQNIGTFVLVILFSLFYITIVFDTDEISEDLQKQGAFIQGIRPGKNTSKFLRGSALKLTAVGALVLAILSILPNLLMQVGFLQSSLISGTGFLILVGVVLDIKRQVQSMAVVRDYNRYL